MASPGKSIGGPPESSHSRSDFRELGFEVVAEPGAELADGAEFAFGEAEADVVGEVFEGQGGEGGAGGAWLVDSGLGQ